MGQFILSKMPNIIRGFILIVYLVLCKRDHMAKKNFIVSENVFQTKCLIRYNKSFQNKYSFSGKLF